MDAYLNSLFPFFPNEGTVSYLIYQAAKRFQGQFYSAACGFLAYDHLDSMSDDLAAYLVGKNMQNSHILFVRSLGTKESYVVLLAGVKAGMTLIDSNDSFKQKEALNQTGKNIVTFKDGYFECGNEKQNFGDCLKIGGGYIFFNIPIISEERIVFILTKNGSENFRTLSHKTAVEMIISFDKLTVDIPLITFFFSWKNNSLV